MNLTPPLVSILISAFLACLISCDGQEINKVLHANSIHAKFRVEGKDNTGNWTISPKINPDIYPLEIEDNDSKSVTFLTDLDSVKYTLGAGQQVDFLVLVNGRDSAFTRIKAVPPRAVFTQEYIKENAGKWTVEIPEVKELLMVIFIISPTGLADTNSMIINHDRTEYYLDVLQQFMPYHNEPIVSIMDSLLRNHWFSNLKADACAYEFGDSNKIRKSPIYDRMRGSSNLLDPYVPLLNDFVNKSNFRAFYESHQYLYDSLIVWHNEALSTKKQWDWLENQFPEHKYDNYKITFSPLVKGNHSTVRFDYNGFKQAVMFIRPPYRVKNVSEDVSNGLITRNVFTEIDHNYVNPETDKYLDQVNVCFKNRDKWTNGKESKGYKTPYTVFNEYMTWSVYLLYMYDQYPQEDFQIINDRIVKYIVERRGFSEFKEFNNTLLNLYMDRSPKTTVADLYKPLLAWASNYMQD